MSFLPLSDKNVQFKTWADTITAYVNSIETYFLGVITDQKFKDILKGTLSDIPTAKNFLTLFTGDQLQHVRSDIKELKDLTTGLTAQYFWSITKSMKSRILKLATQLHNSIVVFIHESISFIQHRVMYIIQLGTSMSVPMMGAFTFDWYISPAYIQYTQTASPADLLELNLYKDFTVAIKLMYTGKIESLFRVLSLEVPVSILGHIGGNICVQCKKPATLQCVRCKNVHYCSTDCQATDWRTGQHKLVCVANKDFCV